MSANYEEPRNRELEGDVHAILMEFRNACLDARSELHQTGDADTTTNKIIIAQSKADVAIRSLISTISIQSRKEGQRSENHYWIDYYSRQIKALDGFDDKPEKDRLKRLRKEHQDRLAQLKEVK